MPAASEALHVVERAARQDAVGTVASDVETVASGAGSDQIAAPIGKAAPVVEAREAVRNLSESAEGRSLSVSSLGVGERLANAGTGRPPAEDAKFTPPSPVESTKSGESPGSSQGVPQGVLRAPSDEGVELFHGWAAASTASRSTATTGLRPAMAVQTPVHGPLLGFALVDGDLLHGGSGGGAEHPAPLDGDAPAPLLEMLSAAASGLSGSSFVPIAALLALLALAVPAILRRLPELADLAAPPPFACALERPG